MCSLFDYGEPLKVLNYMSYEINCVNLFQDETNGNKKSVSFVIRFFNKVAHVKKENHRNPGLGVEFHGFRRFFLTQGK